MGDFEINRPSSTYWNVKVLHERLYQRAGYNEYLAELDILSDGESQEEVTREAKSMLKEQIDETTGGDMQTLLAPQIEPFHVVEAKPTCDSSPASDVPPVSYEVSRVHHEIRAGDISETKLNVGVHTDIQEDLLAVEFWEENV